MNFAPELAAKVMAGEKTVTRRLTSTNPRSPWWVSRCTLQVGRDYAVCPGRGKHAIGRVRVTDVRKTTADPVTDEEAQLEGFADREAFITYWGGMHGAFHGPEIVWRVEFELLGPVAAPAQMEPAAA